VPPHDEGGAGRVSACSRSSRVVGAVWLTAEAGFGQLPVRRPDRLPSRRREGTPVRDWVAPPPGSDAMAAWPRRELDWSANYLVRVFGQWGFRGRQTKTKRAVFAAQHGRARPRWLHPAYLWSLPGATSQGQAEFKLWSWMTIAGLVVAVIVWGLILWAVIAYRRRDPDKMPRQFHSNTFVEIVYTAVPLIIIGVIFFYTVKTENKVDALAPHPAVTIKVTGFQWGWSFSYLNSAGKQIALVETAQTRPPVLAGNPTSPEYPQFVLPLGETRRSCSSQLTWFTASTFRRSTSAAMPCPASRTTSTSLRSVPASSPAIARSTAVFITPRCFSAYASSSRAHSTPG